MPYHRYTLNRLKEFLVPRHLERQDRHRAPPRSVRTTSWPHEDYDVETRANHMMRVRIYFAFLEKQKHIFISPAAGLRMPRGKGGITGVRGWRGHRLCSRSSTSQRRWAFELERSSSSHTRRHCGHARSEMLKLRDIDRTKGVIFIEQSKNLKDRIVPVGLGGARVGRPLRRGGPGHDRDRRRITSSSVTKMAVRSPTAASPGRSPRRAVRRDRTIRMYSMRRSAATNLLAGGMGVVPYLAPAWTREHHDDADLPPDQRARPRPSPRGESSHDSRRSISMTLEEQITEFTNHLEAQSFSPRTVEAYTRHARSSPVPRTLLPSSEPNRTRLPERSSTTTSGSSGTRRRETGGRRRTRRSG